MRSSSRVIAFAALGALTVHAAAQDLSQSVTVQLGVAPVATILASLEKQTGIAFRTGGGVSRDVLFVSVQDVSVKDFMGRLASVDRAEWQKMDGGFRLTRSDSLVRQLEKEEAQLQSETYRKAIARLSQALRPDLPYTAGDAKSESVRSQELLERVRQGMDEGSVSMAPLGSAVSKTPAARAIVSLLSRMNPVELGAMKANTRVVFATNPTLMQKPLPSGAQETIAKFIQEQKTYLESNQGVSGISIAGPGVVSSFQGGPTAGMRPDAAPPAKTLLVGTRFGDRETIMFVLTVYDANGNHLATGMLSIGADPDASQAAAKPADSAAKKIAISALSKEIVELVRGPSGSRSGAQTQVAISTRVAVGEGAEGAAEEPLVFTMSSDEGSPQAKLSVALRERVLHPEKFEPLAILPNEMFQAWAGAQSKNFLASLPDSLFLLSTEAVSGTTFTVEDVVGNAKGRWDLDVQESADWLTVRPKYAATAVSSRVDRVALGKLLRSLATNGRLTLDERAAYAATEGDVADRGGLDAAYIKWTNAAAADIELGSYFGGQREMLKLWGLLSQAQRQSLVRGQPLPLRSLSPAQLKVLDWIVWHSSDGPRFEGGGRGPRVAPIGALMAERTQLLPSGVPGDAILLCQASIEQAVYGMTADGSRGAMMSANDLARNLAMNEPGVNLPTFMNPPAKYERFRMAQQTNLTFRFNLAQRVMMVRRLEDASMVDGPFMRYDQLPGPFRRRVEENAARTRAALEGLRGGLGRRGGQPEAAP